MPLFRMSIKIIVLIAFVKSVSSIGIENEKFIDNSVFDYDLYENVLDPELCQEQLMEMRSFEFYDASFRVPSGILGGNLASMGNFHQCLEISQETENEPIEGKYCMVVTRAPELIFPYSARSEKSWLKELNLLRQNNNSIMTNKYRNILRSERIPGHQRMRSNLIPILNDFEFSLAMCIPKTCTVEDVLETLVDSPLIQLNYWVEFCRLPNDKPLVAADYTAIAIFSVIGVLTLLSTGYDIWHRFLSKKDPAEVNRLLRCCSVYTNTKTFLTFNNIPGAIDCIDGIRSFSMMWVIIGHLFMDYLNKYTANIIELLEWGELRRSIWLISAELAVDTFFALSGLLLVYTYTKKMKQMQLLKSLHLFYLNRLLRMFPLLACAVLLQASLFHHVADGVDWGYMGHFVNMCREYWWSALLHIQNITNPIDQCIPQTWYLSVDVQLHILSPLILFWLLGSRRSAWIGLTIGATSSLIASTVYIFLKDFTAKWYSNEVYYYQNPLTRAPPFVVGMVFGYILHTLRGKKIKLSIWLVGIGYILTSAVSLYCMYSFYRDWENEVVIDLNRSFVRPAWGLYVCWIIFVCAIGYGGPINWFLSLTIWKFMARVSYGMYLFHYAVIWAHVTSNVDNYYFSVGNVFWVFASVMVYTVMISAVACVLIDSPFATLTKMMLNALVPSSKAKTALPTTTTSQENETKDDPRS